MLHAIKRRWDRFGLAIFMMIFAGQSLMAASDADVVTRPVKVGSKLLYAFFAFLYIIVALLWLWLPIVVVFMIYKHYQKKAEQGNDDVSGDMNKAMIFGGVISVVAAFFIIGLLGNLFFPSGAGNDDLIKGIQNFYGNFMTTVRQSVLQQQP